jgi:hypothetical protein
MVFECLKGVLLPLWVGTVIIKQYSILKQRICLQFWGWEMEFLFSYQQHLVITHLHLLQNAEK